MTGPKRRGRPPKSAAPQRIVITAKRVHAGDGVKYDRETHLTVGEDIDLELACAFIRAGNAIILDNKTLEETEAARREAEAIRLIHLQKSRSESVMARHDAMSEDERLRAHTAVEEGSDVGEEI